MSQSNDIKTKEVFENIKKKLESKGIETLLVDDDQSFLEQEEIFLKKEDENLQPDTVVSAEEALEKMENSNYDVIVSDYQMPEMDGLELLEKVREQESDIPFIIFTGKGREEVAMEALNLGADRYLQKGGDPRSQFSVLSKAIEQEENHKNMRTQKEFLTVLYKSIFENTGTAMLVIEKDKTISMVNERFERLLGYSKGEVQGKMNWTEIVPETELERLKEYHETRRNDPGSAPNEYDSRLSTKNGEIKDIQITIGMIPGTDKSIASLLDITNRKKDKRKLEKSKSRLSRTQEVSKVGSWEINLDTGELTWSPETYKIFGIPKEEHITYEKFLKHIHPEDQDYVDKKWNEALETGDYDIEHRIIVNDETKWVHEKADITFNEKGEPIEVIGSVQDITERKQKKKKLEKTRKEYKSLFNSLKDAVFIHDLEGNFIEVNETAVQRLGYPKEELLSLKPIDIDAPEYSEKVAERMKRIKEGDHVVFESKHITKEGKKIPVEINSSLIEYHGESAILSIARDVTERKKMELKLREQRDRAQNYLETAKVMMIVLDPNKEIKMINEKACEVLGYNREDIRDEKWFKNFIPERIRDQVRDVYESLLHNEEKNLEYYDNPVLTKDGEERVIEWHNSVLTDDDGNVDGVLASGTDVTEKRQMEKELREKKEEWEETFNSLEDAIFILDKNHDVKLANNSAENLLNSSKMKIENSKCYELVHDKNSPIDSCPLEKSLRTGEVERSEFYEPNIDKHVLIRTHPITDEDGNIEEFVHQIQDITERKEMEKKLRDSKEEIKRQNEFLNDVFEAFKNPLMVVDADDYSIEMANSEASKLGEWESSKCFEFSHNSSKPCEEIGIDCPLEEVKEAKSPVVMEHEHLDEDNNSRFYEIHGYPIMNDEDEVFQMIEYVLDITERKKAKERQELLHSLLRHDVRNKAQTIQGYLQLLEDLKLEEEAIKYIKRAKNGNKKEIDLINKVSLLRKAEEEQTHELNVKSSIHDAVDSMKELADEKEMKININCPEDSCIVKAGPLLNELFSNILENAIQHSKGQKIKISKEETEEKIICIIEDDGIGIPDDEKNKIFEKGYTTDKERGTGLGMFLVEMLLDIYDGDIRVKDSEIGGAKFEIHLMKT